MRTVVETIPDGTPGVRVKLSRLRSLIDKGKADPSVRSLALRAIAGVRERDWRGEVDAVHRAVRNRIRYTMDPVGVELFVEPGRLLGEPAGDCDDHAALLGALLESIGHPVRLRVGGPGGGKWSHVWLDVQERGRGWRALDPVAKMQALDFDPSRNFPVTMSDELCNDGRCGGAVTFTPAQLGYAGNLSKHSVLARRFIYGGPGDVVRLQRPKISAMMPSAGFLADDDGNLGRSWRKKFKSAIKSTVNVKKVVKRTVRMPLRPYRAILRGAARVGIKPARSLSRSFGRFGGKVERGVVRSLPVVGAIAGAFNPAVGAIIGGAAAINQWQEATAPGSYMQPSSGGDAGRGPESFIDYGSGGYGGDESGAEGRGANPIIAALDHPATWWVLGGAATLFVVSRFFGRRK